MRKAEKKKLKNDKAVHGIGNNPNICKKTRKSDKRISAESLRIISQGPHLINPGRSERGPGCMFEASISLQTFKKPKP